MKPTACLWFEEEAEEAAKFYVSVFKGKSKIKQVMPGPGGRAMAVDFTLDGQPFTALNGNVQHKFNESSSFVIVCRDRKEIDRYWSKLLAGGGVESMCGWLKERFGVSWQVIPKDMGKLLRRPGAVQAMLEMQKIDIAGMKGT